MTSHDLRDLQLVSGSPRDQPGITHDHPPEPLSHGSTIGPATSHAMCTFPGAYRGFIPRSKKYDEI